MYIRSITKFRITVACGLKFNWYLRILSLKFEKATRKIEVFQSLPCLAWGPPAILEFGYKDLVFGRNNG